MFRNSRPTPSPQTIELIRQLAYISGGALCGVTALYLEECRRRMQILQRVLDKRRLIVQVGQTRRYSKVALAARHEASHLEQLHALGYTSQSWDGRDESIQNPTRPPRKRDGRAIHASDSSAGSSSYLPFYQPTDSLRPHLDYGDVTPTTSEFGSQTTLRTYAPLLSDNSTSSTVPTDQQTGLSDFKQDVAQVHDIPQSPLRTRRQRALLNRRPDGRGELNMARRAWSDRSHDTPSVTAISQSSRNRLVSQRITSLIERSRFKQDSISKKVSEALLPEALRTGTLRDIRRLCNWMLENGVFTTDHGKLLVDSCPQLAKTFAHEDIFAFFASVLTPPRFGVTELEEVFRLKIKFLVHALNWHVSPIPTDYGESILNDSWSLDTQTKAGVLNTECKYLLSDMQSDRATDLFLTVTRCSWAPTDSSVFSELSSLADDIMMSAINEELESYKRLLLWKSRFQAPRELKPQYNTFVEACGRQRSYQLLAEFITHGGRGWSTSSLIHLADGINKAIISVAFSVDVQLVTIFPDVYRRVPEPFRHYVDEFASVESLRTTWKAKHNIEMIEVKAIGLSTRLEKQGDEQTLLKVDEALLEIYMDNNDHDKAFECMSRMHKIRQGDVRFLALAATYFSSRWAWDGLARLLEISKSHGPFTFDENSSRLFNTVIRAYAMYHSPRETWTFINNAVDDLGFLPNFATVQTMLFKILREKSIDLMPRWLRFMSAIGSNFDITGYLAADLIRYYWVWNRQPSDLLFRLCHRLTASVPHLNADHFRDTLKMAVGHDRRFGGSGGDAYMVQKEALTLLEQLDAADDIVPLPDSAEPQTSDTSGFPLSEHHAAVAPQQRSHASEERYYQTLAVFNDGVDPDQEEQISGLNAEVPCTNADVEDPFRRRAYASRGQEERTRAKARSRQTDVDMTMALSLSRYQEALDIYHASCDAAGLPASMNALKNAVYASIGLHQGDTDLAANLLADAKQSGLDVHRAMDPLLVQRSSKLAISDVREARRVCDATTKYYEENHRNGYPVKFALAHNVANTLTVRGHAAEALRLLSTVFQSDYITRLMPSIQTMSVWIKAYAQLLSIEGIRWVTMRVLSKNLTIDSIFLNDFEKVTRQPFTPDQHKLIRSWLRKCEERRREQDLEAKIFGNQLVDCIVEYTHKYPQLGRPPRPDNESERDAVPGSKIAKHSPVLAAASPKSLENDHSHQQPHVTRRRRRRNVVRKVREPGFEVDTPAGVQQDSYTTLAPF